MSNDIPTARQCLAFRSLPTVALASLGLVMSAGVLAAQTVSQDYARYASMLSQERSDQAHREQQSLGDESSRNARSAPSSSSSSSSSYGSLGSSSRASTDGRSEIVGLLGNTLNNMVDRHNAAEAARNQRDDAAKARFEEQTRANQKASDDFIEAWEKAHPLIQRNLEKASQGDLTAMADAGIQYAHGIGVPRNKERGLDLLSNAASHGNMDAAGVLAYAYQDGDTGFVAMDKVKSREWTMVGVKLGEADAMRHACMQSMDGTGTKRDYVEAERLCNLGIAKGDGNSANTLGYMYSAKLPGLPPDRAKSETYLLKGIKLGKKAAMEILANVYNGADGLPPDHEKRVALLKPWAENGDPVAEVEVGIAYYLGKGVAKNDSLAVSWLRRSVTAGSARGRYELASLVEEGEGTPKDPAEALTLKRRAAVEGWPPALFEMGILTINGNGVQQDQIEGERLLRIAAERGESHAPCELGRMYARGIGGVEKDVDEARRWFRMGTARGNTKCTDEMRKLP
ncbi:hypothetical protein BH11GEM2_BH11GEM2_14460 [soil metagenome]